MSGTNNDHTDVATPRWNIDEIADACVRAGLGILECNSLIVTLKGASFGGGAEKNLKLTDVQVDDLAFGYCPSGKIGELRDLIRAVESTLEVIRAKRNADEQFLFAKAITLQQDNAFTESCVFCGGSKDLEPSHEPGCVYVKAAQFLADTDNPSGHTPLVNSGTANSFLALPDDAKREFFATSVAESEQLKKALAALQNIRDCAVFDCTKNGDFYYSKAENALAEIECRDAKSQTSDFKSEDGLALSDAADNQVGTA